MGIVSTLKHLAAVLTDGGVVADMDTTRLQPPCAWVTPATADIRTASRTPRYKADVYLIVRDTGYADSVAELEKLMNASLEAIRPDPDLVIDGPVDLSAGVDVSGKVLPAFKLTIELEDKE